MRFVQNPTNDLCFIGLCNFTRLLSVLSLLPTRTIIFSTRTSTVLAYYVVRQKHLSRIYFEITLFLGVERLKRDANPPLILGTILQEFRSV